MTKKLFRQVKAMRRYKMICLDIDGTLLNSMHEITENTKKAIRKVANEKQIPVVLVSARMPKGMVFLQQELKLVQPIICYSGALIWENGNVLSSIVVPAAEAAQIYILAKETGIHMSLYKEDEWYVEAMDRWAEQEGEITKSTPVITGFADLLSTWGQENSGPNKILCMAEPEGIKLFQERTAACFSGSLNIYPSKTTYLEITSANATKTSAIELLSRIYGIEKSEIIAIGDNYNDVNMLEFAGLGIAMGNAPDDVKKFAQAITLSNNEDGVAEALVKHILSKL